jgi:hypothetical protein
MEAQCKTGIYCISNVTVRYEGNSVPHQKLKKMITECCCDNNVIIITI